MARERYGIQTLMADTTGANLRMQHILMKLGFRLVERVEDAYELGLQREDRLCYTLTLDAAK